MAAGDTNEVRLIAAACGIDDAASCACLTGVGGWYFDQPPAALHQLVGQHDTEGAPALIEDRPVEAGFLPHAPARRCRRSCPRCGLVPPRQRLHNNRAVVLGNGCTVLVEKVLSGVRYPLLNPCHAADGFAPVNAAAPFPRQAALRPPPRP